jgi:hypothetical protein
MTTIQNVNGAHGISPTVGETSSTIAAGAESPGLLPEPVGALGDDAYTELAMLLTKADESDRKASRTLEQTADQAATAEENQRVQEMQDKAQQDEMQGWATGLGDIAAGACTIGGAFAAGGSSSGSGDAASPSSGADVTPTADASKQATNHFDWHTALPGIGSGAQGAGVITAGAFKSNADGDDGRAAQHDARSQAQVRFYNEVHDRVSAANDSMQKVEQFLQQIQQTQNATRLAAATRA